MIRCLRIVVVVAALASVSPQLAAQTDLGPLRVDPVRYLAHVKTLSSDDFAGRGNGTVGIERAADYIAGEFRKAGLAPGGETNSYFQAFDIASRLELDSRATFVVSSAGVATSFRLGAQYHPLSVTDSARPAKERLAVVFAGYGISAPGLGYDDYAGVDVSGKAVIVFTHEPQEDDEKSIFEGRALTPHSDIAQKAAQARKRGAQLLIVVEDPTHSDDRALTPAWRHDPQIDALDFAVVRADRSRLARALGGLDFDRVARDIDVALQPQSRPLPSTISYTEPAAIQPQARNVIGVLQGADRARAGDAIVIGAHYDHLGLGGRLSRAPNSAGEIHNGADDNASGTAAIIEMAHRATANRKRFGRTLIFIAFAAEEIGLVGSRHYVDRPRLPMSRTKAMINLDMIGRARGRVLVGGPDRSPWLGSLVEGIRPLSPLTLEDFSEGYEDGASDDAPFSRAGVPALTFFTGFHDDYHRPSDDWDHIDATGAAEIATIALAIVERMASS